MKHRVINELSWDSSNFESYQVFDVHWGLYVRVIERTKSPNHVVGESTVFPENMRRRFQTQTRVFDTREI